MAEGLATEVTAVGPQATVDPLMVLQIDGMSERLMTVFTLKRLLSSVDELMAFKGDGTSEAFPTNPAYKELLARMCECMPLQVLCEAEVSTADVTAVWFLACVDHGVRPQLCLFGEGLSTLRALVRPLVRVQAGVAKHALLQPKGASTDTAEEWLLTRVDSVVLLQVPM